MSAATVSAKSNIARGIGRLTDLVFTSGKGSYVQTTCGQTLLDFTTGIGVVNTGHCHPRVVAAAKAQCDNIIHSQVNIGYHDKKLELTETLMPLLPKHLDTIFYGTTGAEAVENSIKMAKAYTGKPGVIVFRGGYHGRTFGTMAMTVSILFASIRLFVVMFGVFIPSAHSIWSVLYYLDIITHLQTKIWCTTSRNSRDTLPLYISWDHIPKCNG